MNITNVTIVLTDEQRSRITNWMDSTMPVDYWLWCKDYDVIPKELSLTVADLEQILGHLYEKEEVEDLQKHGDMNRVTKLEEVNDPVVVLFVERVVTLFYLITNDHCKLTGKPYECSLVV